MKEELIKVIDELGAEDLRLLYIVAIELAKAKRMGCDYEKREND